MSEQVVLSPAPVPCGEYGSGGGTARLPPLPLMGTVQHRAVRPGVGIRIS